MPAIQEGNDLLCVDLVNTHFAGAKSLQIDLRDPEFTRISSDFKPEIIVHLAGLQFSKPIPRWKRKAFFFGNIEMAEAISKLIETNSDVCQVIFVSTDMVYGFPDSGLVTSTKMPKPIGPYGQSKLQSEKLLSAVAVSNKITLTVFRPRLINGPGRAGTIATLAKFIKWNFPVPIIGKGNNKYQMVSVSDVVSAIKAAIITRESGIFNLGSANPPTVNELLTSSIKEVGSRSRLVHLPEAPALFLLRVLDRVGLSPLSEEQFEIASLDYELDVTVTESALNWQATESDFQIMKAALTALKQGGPELEDVGDERA